MVEFLILVVSVDRPSTNSIKSSQGTIESESLDVGGGRWAGSLVQRADLDMKSMAGVLANEILAGSVLGFLLGQS
jgi:hypothetical protein